MMPSESMRVVMITRYYPPSIGGVQHQVADLAAGLATHGIEVHILTEHGGNAPKFESINSVKVHRSPRPNQRLIAWPILVLKYLALIKRLQPNLVHAHRITPSTSTIAIIAKWLFKVPIIVTAHGAGKQIGDMARVKRTRYRKIYLAVLRRAVASIGRSAVE